MKKFLSLVASAVMMFSLVAMPVHAEENVASAEELKAAVEKGGTITLASNIDLPTAIVVEKDVTLNLNDKTLTVKGDTAGDGVFHVTKDSTLTINGEGTINGVGNNDYNIAVWADGGKVVINGGHYTNVGATATKDPSHFDLIYVKNNGSVTINGGTFECQTPKWTLNSHDTEKGTFTVNGGTFIGYNPAESETENPIANFVADGYVCVKEGSKTTVRKLDLTNVASAEELKAAVEKGGTITLASNIDLPTAIVVKKDVTLNLNGKTLTVKEDTVGDGVFHVKGGTLTINGDGTINGVGNNDYNIAVWADGGKVVINGGHYTNVGATATKDPSHFDLIYVKNNGSVTINGGTFECQTPKWTLNSHDTEKGTFTVNGGTFIGYNPAESETENPIANFVADGFKAEGNENVFTVVHAHDLEHFNSVEANCIETGNIEYWYCETCDKYYADENAINVIAEEDIVIAKKSHSLKEVEEVVADCDSTGVKAHAECTVCETLFESITSNKIVTREDLVVPALGHTETKIPAVAATCEKTGLTEGTKCSVCNEILKAQEVEKALGHKEVVEGAKEATCKEEGHTGNKVCEVCDKVLEEGKAIAKKAHTYRDGKCTVCGTEDPDYVQTTTGDNAPVMMYATMTMMAAAALIVLKKKESLVK